MPSPLARPLAESVCRPQREWGKRAGQPRDSTSGLAPDTYAQPWQYAAEVLLYRDEEVLRRWAFGQTEPFTSRQAADALGRTTTDIAYTMMSMHWPRTFLVGASAWQPARAASLPGQTMTESPRGKRLSEPPDASEWQRQEVMGTVYYARSQ